MNKVSIDYTSQYDESPRSISGHHDAARDMIPLLIEQLKDGLWPVRESAARVLGRLGEKGESLLDIITLWLIMTLRGTS